MDRKAFADMPAAVSAVPVLPISNDFACNKPTTPSVGSWSTNPTRRVRAGLMHSAIVRSTADGAKCPGMLAAGAMGWALEYPLAVNTDESDTLSQIRTWARLKAATVGLWVRSIGIHRIDTGTSATRWRAESRALHLGGHDTKMSSAFFTGHIDRAAGVATLRVCRSRRKRIATVHHWHAELLLGRHSHPDWLQALDRCYAAFGIPGWSLRAHRTLTARIQAAFRRVAEAIAVSWGWVPITTDPYAWLADHCQYFSRPRQRTIELEGAA